MVSATLITAILLALLAAGLGAAYTSDALDPIIQKLGVMMFEAKAQAGRKKLQAQGMNEGQDFMDDQLKDNQQAGQAAGFGNMKDQMGGQMGGAMKKQF